VDVIDLGAARRARDPSVGRPGGVAEPVFAQRDDGDDRLSVRASLLVVMLLSGIVWAGLIGVVEVLVG
jgi:hypothetical protein